MHLLLTIYRAKAYMMEKARNNSDPESPQNGDASLHYKDSSVTFPVRREWSFQLGKKKKKKILVRLHLMHGTGPWAPSSRVSQQEWTLLYGGSPTLLILMIVRVLYLVQTCLELQKQLQGVARCTKKITLKTVQIGIIYRELKKGIQE